MAGRGMSVFLLYMSPRRTWTKAGLVTAGSASRVWQSGNRCSMHSFWRLCLVQWWRGGGVSSEVPLMCGDRPISPLVLVRFLSLTKFVPSETLRTKSSVDNEWPYITSSRASSNWKAFQLASYHATPPLTRYSDRGCLDNSQRRHSRRSVLERD